MTDLARLTGGRRLIAVILLLGMVLTACSESTDRRLVDGYFEEITDQPFYTLPSPVPAGGRVVVRAIQGSCSNLC